MQDLRKLTAPQILQAVRNGDLNITRALVQDGIKSKKYTLNDYVELLEAQGLHVDKSTISRWSKGVK